MIKTNTTGQVGIGALALGLVLAALMSVMLAASKPAHAANTFTVSSTLDLPDLNVGDGVCDAITSGGAQCGLRAAIQEANHPNSPGADVINFNINSGGGVATIRPGSALPIITEAVTIDGYTQPGASPNTLDKGTNAVLKIRLDGSNAEGNFVDGLDVRADNVVVRGLVIDRFSDDGIDTFDGTGVRIEGNFIGTDALGTQVLGNGGNGVFIDRGSGNTVGGRAPETRNLISGNDDDGVVLFSGTNNTKVEGNLIGTNKDGKSPLGNTGDGVNIINSSGNFVGGFSPSAANTIAFNNGDGVNAVSSFAELDATGNRVLANSIFSNGRLGIDLVGGTENETGATKNDPKDPDAGPNDLQNKPKIKSATTSGGKTTIKGKLNSTSRDPFVIQFFSNPPGTDEGKKFLGDKSVSTDPDGNVTFTFELNQKVDAGANITATATNVVEANTSEFSGPRAVVAQ